VEGFPFRRLGGYSLPPLFCDLVSPPSFPSPFAEYLTRIGQLFSFFFFWFGQGVGWVHFLSLFPPFLRGFVRREGGVSSPPFFFPFLSRGGGR